MRNVMSRFGALLALLLCALASPAQTTSVNATIADPAGTSWSNAQWTATVISSLNPPVTLPGYNTFTTTYSGVADVNGTFNVTVQRVANIYPANSTWQFCVVSGVTFPQQFCTNIPVGNAGQSSQNISAQINAVVKTPVVSGGVGISAYTDAEVLPVMGAQYYNVKLNAFRCYNGTWSTCGGGGGGGGNFPTNAIVFGIDPTTARATTHTDVNAMYTSTAFQSGQIPYITTNFAGTTGNPITGTQPEVLDVPGTTWANWPTVANGGVFKSGGGVTLTANQANVLNTARNDYVVTFSGLTNTASMYYAVRLDNTSSGGYMAVGTLGSGGVILQEINGGVTTTVGTSAVANGATGSIVVTLSGNSIVVVPFNGSTISYTIPAGHQALNGGYLGILNLGAANQTVGGISIIATGKVPVTVACAGFLNSDGTCSTGGANTIVANDGNGHMNALPEMPTKTDANGVTTKVSDEDTANGRFDCRNPAYAGGCLGTTPGLAMQAMSDAVVCYQAISGKRANVNFPPGVWNVGTPTFPTLSLPTGAYYSGASGNYNATATQFQSTYNNVLTVHFSNFLTATCSDGLIHMSTLYSGRYEGFGQHGCGQGGCINVPLDTGDYPSGGPHQKGIQIDDLQGYVNLVGAVNNGDTNVEVGGLDTETGIIWGASPASWYIFGQHTAGQTYDPTTDTQFHCNIVLSSLDGTFNGPFETYGWLQAPGSEYGKVCAVAWLGGNSHMGPLFSNRDAIGIIRPGGNNNGRLLGGRIDGPMGEGIVMRGGGNTMTSIDNSTSCSGLGSIPPGTVFGPYIKTLGSGMTNNTYVVPASAGDATLTVVVAGGKASTISVSNAGTQYEYVTTPTFTMTGTGGTAATIGAITYQHCDRLDDTGGLNSYVNVRNIFENFFGADHTTGDIWFQGNTGSTFDRSTTGSFERVVAGVNNTASSPKGENAHKDSPDLFVGQGGVVVTGPGVHFTNGNHFRSGDGSATSWTGPFIVDNIMQDLWIMGGNANTTLPATTWQTCSGHDLNLAAARWYHFLVYQDDEFNTLGTNFIFREQCDTVNQDYWQVNFAALSSPPATSTLASLDVAGSAAVRALPALSAGAVTSAGGGSSFSYCFVSEVWVGGGKQTNAPVCTSKTPVVPTGSNNLFYQQQVPENWTRYKLIFQSTTDSGFTASLGTMLDVTAPGPTPQPTLFIRIAVQPSQLSGDAAVIATVNLSLNMTGTFNFDASNIPVTSTLCTQGQTKIDPSGSGVLYYCTAEDTWVALNFGGGGGGAAFPGTNGIVFNTSTTASRNATATDIGTLGTLSNNTSGSAATAGTATTITGTVSSTQVVPNPLFNGYIDALQATGGTDIYPAAPSTGVRFTSCTGAPCYEDVSGAFWNLPRLNGSNTFSGVNTFSASAALSAPAIVFSGSPITGGTGTTTVPLILIQPTATSASTIWSTSGTMLGVNAPSGFTGNALDLQVNSVDLFKVSSSGNGTFAGTVLGNALSATNNITGKNYLTVSNCASAGGTCVSAAAGMVTVAVSATTVTVTDTSVTANSEIILTPVASTAAGTRLSVTCNSTPVLAWVSSQTAATGFVITVASAPSVNPECISFHIFN